MWRRGCRRKSLVVLLDIETDGGGVDAELFLRDPAEWHRDNCLTWTLQMEGWEEGMATTWRGERNMLEKDVEL